ncbi:MAG: ferritin-like domain-containing protein, partial [Sphingomonas sp.]
MIDSDTLIQVIDAGERRRIERRRFLTTAGQTGLAAGGLALLGACGGSGSGSSGGTGTPTPTPTPSPTDTAFLAD